MSDVKAMLLTDVVDSTSLAETLGDRLTASLWSAHDRLARDLLPHWRGREIDKSDGMLLLFESAPDAVGYALAYQRALATLVPPLRARAGLHVGTVMLRENSAADVARGAKPLEVDGAAKAITARIMSIASGGQILLSSDARRALDRPELRIESHGHWRLKGLAEPLKLFEVGDARASFTPPPDAEKAYRVVRQDDLWLPVREIRHSLPAERDAFVGRRDELAELSRCVQSGARLVSVLGIGGTGKTRLVTRFGWTWLGEFPGGVWFCDLSAARGVDGIVHAVAQGLDVPLGRAEPVAQLGQAIAGRGRCLVILDNFEQVARHAEQTLGCWLALADHASYVVTSREVLGLAGEQVFALAPLPPPDGAALFVRRAAAAGSGFEPQSDDEATITALVTLLDGLPLAIELAAARTRVMPPRMLLQRMSERFTLIASTGRPPDRQSTLRSAFDWSWDLLQQAEKATLAQLSVFEGGFTLEAAEALLDLSGFDARPWSVDAVQSLVDKSFVRLRVGDRFDLLVSVQEYADEHLRTEGRFAGSGPRALAAAQARHIAWFAALGPIRSVAGRCADLDNLVVACRRAISLDDGDSAAAALEGAAAALTLRGPLETCLALAESVCAMPGLTDRAAARALAVLGRALVAFGRTSEARDAYGRSLVHARGAADAHCETRVTMNLGEIDVHEGRIDKARDRFTAATQMAGQHGDRRLECAAINCLGNSEFFEGRADEASKHYEAALALAREIGDRHMQGKLLGNLGSAQHELGQMDEARAHYEQALDIARETGNRPLEGNTLSNLGELYVVLDRLEDAVATSQAALTVAGELGYSGLQCSILGSLGMVCEKLGRPTEALAHLEAAVRSAHALGNPRDEGQALGRLGLLHARQGRHAEALHCLDAGETLLREVSGRFDLGVLLTSRAEAQQLSGDTEAARATLDAARAIATNVDSGPASELGLALARLHARIGQPNEPGIGWGATQSRPTIPPASAAPAPP